MEDSPESLGEDEVCHGRLYKSGQNGYTPKSFGIRGRVSLVRPTLPPFLNDIEITNLRIGAAIVDLHLTRHGDDVSAKVFRRKGELEILISQ